MRRLAEAPTPAASPPLPDSARSHPAALQDGIATYQRALQQQPDSKDLWLNLGMAQKELCAVDRAREARAGGCSATAAARPAGRAGAWL